MSKILIEKEIVELALEALEQLKGELYEEVYVNGLTGVLDKPIAAIKEALMSQSDGAQPSGSVEQGDVTLDVSGLTGFSLIPANWDSCAPNEYNTLPPVPEAHKRTWVNATEWRGLTDDEITDAVNDMGPDAGSYEHRLSKAIEAKLKQKNGYAEEKNT